MSIHQESLSLAFSSDVIHESLQQRLHGFLHQAAALLLIAILAVPMLIIAIMVKISCGGQVFFAHYRVGKNGDLFRCLKFRSMVVDADQVLQELLAADPAARAEWAEFRKLRKDPRITPVGHFLRVTSLDELPQIFNVLRGEMALVGPRPITLDEVDRYGRTRWLYLQARPGMTGLWQVSGRNLTTFEERVELDRTYVNTRTIWLDIKIMLKTVRVILFRDGAF
jgi:exopolysaccharide production protein ExoY